VATTKYPTLEEALELHRALIERFGGSDGVRDLGVLESALFRPQTGYYDALSMEAAALMQSLAMNHPFVDGNKRVAFALTAIFLRINGYRVVATADDAEQFLIERVIRQHAPLDEIERWLADHMTKV
jgi:death on curing protein